MSSDLCRDCFANSRQSEKPRCYKCFKKSQPRDARTQPTVTTYRKQWAKIIKAVKKGNGVESVSTMQLLLTQRIIQDLNLKSEQVMQLNNIINEARELSDSQRTSIESFIDDLTEEGAEARRTSDIMALWIDKWVEWAVSRDRAREEAERREAERRGGRRGGGRRGGGRRRGGRRSGGRA